MVSRIFATLARRQGGRFLGRSMDRYLPIEPVSLAKPSTIVGGIATAIAVRIATSSVPGALLVGGGLLAKALIEKGRAQRDAASARSALAHTAAETPDALSGCAGKAEK